jgi:hypothetical protein
MNSSTMLRAHRILVALILLPLLVFASSNGLDRLESLCAEDCKSCPAEHQDAGCKGFAGCPNCPALAKMAFLTPASFFPPTPPVSFDFGSGDWFAPEGLPESIDHPPQLS